MIEHLLSTRGIGWALLGLGGALLAVAVWLKRLDDRLCAFANATHAETAVRIEGRDLRAVLAKEARRQGRSAS